MPQYNYRCGCGYRWEMFSSVAKFRVRRKCSECGEKAPHDFVADHAGGGVASQMQAYDFEGDTGTRMYGASYLPNQAAEAKRKHPGCEFVLRNNCLLPVIKHRRHRLQYLKQYGNYVELN